MIRFEYRLTGHGWSEATIADRDTKVELTASYLSDALGNLARAVVRLMRGMEQARVSWDEEPGEYRWLMVRTDERVSIRILWFDSQFPERPDQEGRTVFETSCRLVDLAGQVTSQLLVLLETLGEAEYIRQWGMEFPRNEYEALVSLRRQRRAGST
jgi:hypothetical protein